MLFTSEVNYEKPASLSNNLFIIDEGYIEIKSLPKISIYRCTFDTNNFSQNIFKQHNIDFISSLSTAVNSRKSEYLAGRYCASKALEKLNITSANIVPGKHRCPTWPSAVIGSITHTSSTAYSAVSNSSKYQYLGIDYEELMTEKTASELQSIIINDTECNILKNLELSFEEALTLTFSAKESLFKAIYPQVGEYFDFKAAEITEYSVKNNSFELKLNVNLTANLTKGTLFYGYMFISKTHILTIIAG